jgi:multiple sugar transport system substrate-binding protein
VRNILAALFILVLLGGAWAQDRENVTLLFWPPENENMQVVIDAYNEGPGAEGGVFVDQLVFSRQGYFDKELADLAAGSTEFDLALVTTYTLGRFAPYLESIGDCVSEEVFDVMLPASTQSMRFGGELYGIPTDVSLHFMYYRQDLIDELLQNEEWRQRYAEIAEEHLGEALSPVPPDQWTWRDYVATSLFFTRSINRDSPTRYGTALQLRNLIFNIMLWQNILVSQGGNWMSEDGEVTLDSPEARRALEVYQTIIDASATPPGSINYEYPETNEAFRSGQVATALQWNAAFNGLNDPELSPQVAGKIGLAPPPAGPEGHRTHVHSLGIGMNGSSEHKEAACNFLSFLGTEEAMEIYAGVGGIPPVASVLEGRADERPEFQNTADYLQEHGFVVRGGTADYAVPVYEVLAEEFSAVWSGQRSIDEALQSAQRRVEEIVSE